MMPAQIGKGRRASGPRHHWIVYVLVALFGGLLTFVAARAQQKASDETTFRKLVDEYCQAWSSLKVANAARLYAKEDNLVFYDLTPFSYLGWKNYEPGVQKAVLDGAASLSLTAGKDLRVTRRGNIAWTMVPVHIKEQTKDGKNAEFDARCTLIWEKHGKNWLIVHEHLSVPLGG